MTKPCLSIVLPTYNHASGLCGCLDDILAQTFCDYEIIAADDGSTDNTRETITDFIKTNLFI